MRGCDVCDKTDNGPRHVIAGRGDKPPTTRHFGCCASRGCDICDQALKEN